jgi:hypothetical protein
VPGPDSCGELGGPRQEVGRVRQPEERGRARAENVRKVGAAGPRARGRPFRTHSDSEESFSRTKKH